MFQRLWLLWLICFGVTLPAQIFKRPIPAGFISQEWLVDGVKRTALVRLPVVKSAQPAPVVFGWHGHMGNSANSIRSWEMDELWPEAIFVFPQGLPTASPLVDKEGRFPGWQVEASTNGGRDSKFFDAMLASLRKEQTVDDRRIYSIGHSNGAAFSYLLWQARGDTLAAIGTVAGVMVKPLGDYRPLPVLHIAGENDPVVKYEWQKLTFMAVKKINACDEQAQPWAGSGILKGEIFPSSKGAPLVTVVHAGKHEYPKGASELIIRFLKEQARPVK